MNKYLEKFIYDELSNNNYYEGIRNFIDGKDWDYNVESVMYNYERNMDNFGPYSFMDAIEDYLNNTEPETLATLKDLDEVIEKMWNEDYFDDYHV